MSIKIEIIADTVSEIIAGLDAHREMFANALRVGGEAEENPAHQAVKPPISKRILPRFKDLTGLSDSKIAAIMGLPRSTIQAYVSGRLDEKLDAGARPRLAAVVRDKLADIEALLNDLES